MLTQKFSGANGQVKKLHCVHVDGKFQPVAGSEFEIEADLVLLAMGFVHPLHDGMIKALDVALDARGNVTADTNAYRDLDPEGVRRRRHAPRPVAGGVGDPRRPPGRARGRQIPDGIDDAAALSGAYRSQPKSARPRDRPRRARHVGLRGRRIFAGCSCEAWRRSPA